MKKQVIVCDGCGKILERKHQIYKLYLKTDKFWDGVGSDYLTTELHFCENCARDVKKVLEEIAKNCKKEG